MKEKLRKVELDYQKDKEFYEEALETRMNQLDELEQTKERLEDQVASLKDELASQKGAAKKTANTSVCESDSYLKEEVHQVKLELKDATTENKELKRQV